MSRSPVIALRDVAKRYALTSGTVQALAGISLDIFAGEMVAIVGGTGAGKTSLLAIIAARLAPTRGDVTVLGQRLSAHETLAQRHFVATRIHTLFERTELRTSRTVLANLVLRDTGPAHADRVARGRALLRSLGLEHRAHAAPTQLSSGERQLVALAHALVGTPRIVLVDEPGRHLGRGLAERAVARLALARRTSGVTVVFGTQHRSLAARADRIVFLHAGAITHELQPRRDGVCPPPARGVPRNDDRR